MKQASDLLKKIADNQNVRAVVLTDGDGFAMEKEIRDNNIDADFLAVISRDMVAAARKMFFELDKGQFMQGVIEYSNGVVLFTNLPRGAYLVVLTSKNANKAKVWDSIAGNFRGLLEII
jgi:predicted regulator of Ras-like GTPase activity (Roadblock/LC7/MglB family)